MRTLKLCWIVIAQKVLFESVAVFYENCIFEEGYLGWQATCFLVIDVIVGENFAVKFCFRLMRLLMNEYVLLETRLLLLIRLFSSISLEIEKQGLLVRFLYAETGQKFVSYGKQVH